MSSISSGTTTTTALVQTADTSGVLQLQTNGTTTAVTIDTSQNVGVGVTPSAWTGTNGGAFQFGSGYSSLYSYSNAVTLGSNVYYNAGNKYFASGVGASAYQQLGGVHYWLSAPSGTAGNAITFTQAMTLDASGRLLVGGTTATNFAWVESFFNGASYFGVVANDTANNAGTTYFAAAANGTTIGSITRVGATNAVVYNTTSDQRLKSNIQTALPVLDKLMQVQVRQYDWTEGDLHQDYGFVAQELEPILSGIVTKGKTEEDVWQLDYSRLTPHLVKAIQELSAQVTTLQSQVTALKG